MISLVIHWNLDPVIIRVFGFGIRYYSLCWIAGIVLAYIVARKRLLKLGETGEGIDMLLVYVVLGALIGARLGHCLFYDWKYFSRHLLEIIFPVSISSGKIAFTGYLGLASHGGAAGIVAALFLFHRKYKVPFLFLLDALAYIAPLTGAFIRIGNFFNSEIIGAPTDSALAVVFDRVDVLPRHPAQLYEAVAYLLIFLILYLFLRWAKDRKPGQLFGLSLVLIFSARFVIEFCKEVQEPFEIGLRSTVGLDMGQLLSIPFILVGLYFLLLHHRGKEVPGKVF
ncbi:MAG: prolipoprotein diacylglyceryl transferase [Bacteroidales bacterium]|nr:prolipoprotein diacylglyceryl transferase [Bacteroidales bacterium]